MLCCHTQRPFCCPERDQIALQRCCVNEAASVTVLTDGDVGLRAIQREVAPHADHVLDWSHISMRFTNLQEIAKGVNAIVDGGVKAL
jgi:hypothetical protein